MRLDHVSYACHSGELAEVVQRIGSDLGSPFVDGGIHPSFGTRNFTLPLAGGCYVEVVAALDHPAADKAPFGRAVRRRADEGGGWLSWVIAVDDISPVEQRLGRTAAAGHRIRPDGSELRWKQIGILDVMDHPDLPFFVEWESTDLHPGNPRGDVELTGIELNGDEERLSAVLVGDGEVSRHIVWVEDDEPGIVACRFNTPRGIVRID